MVVLVKNPKDALGLRLRPAKSCQRQWASETAGELAVLLNDVAQADRIRVARRSYGVNPEIGAGFAIGHVDVEEIGLGGASETLQQLLRAVDRAKSLSSGHGDARHVVEAGDFIARNPQPGRRTITGFALAGLTST